MERYKPFFESQNDIKKGDIIKFGKYKNKTATVTGFGTDKNNQPTVITDKGEMSLYHVRIDKLMKEEMQQFPSETLEKILGISGLSYKYKLPNGKDEHYWGDKILEANEKGNPIFIDRFYTTLLKNNKELKKLNIKHKATKKDYGDEWFIIWGVLSRFTVEDIQYFIDGGNMSIESTFKKINKYLTDEYITFLPSKKHQKIIQQAFEDRMHSLTKLMKEDLHLSDFTKHAGISPFGKKFMLDRQKIKGAGNVSAKIKSIKVNRKKDYITIVFTSAPTYTKIAKAVSTPSMEITKRVKAYEQQIRFLKFFEWAKTKPGYKESELTWKEIKEVLSVCSVEVFCSCPSYWWQGMAWVDTLFDAAIFKSTIPPKRWTKYHQDYNFSCKHLDILFTSGFNLYIQNITSMVNKYLKQVNAGK